MITPADFDAWLDRNLPYPHLNQCDRYNAKAILEKILETDDRDAALVTLIHAVWATALGIRREK